MRLNSRARGGSLWRSGVERRLGRLSSGLGLSTTYPSRPLLAASQRVSSPRPARCAGRAPTGAAGDQPQWRSPRRSAAAPAGQEGGRGAAGGRVSGPAAGGARGVLLRMPVGSGRGQPQHRSCEAGGRARRQHLIWRENRGGTTASGWAAGWQGRARMHSAAAPPGVQVGAWGSGQRVGCGALRRSGCGAAAAAEQGPAVGSSAAHRKNPFCPAYGHGCCWALPAASSGPPALERGAPARPLLQPGRRAGTGSAPGLNPKPKPTPAPKPSDPKGAAHRPGRALGAGL